MAENREDKLLFIVVLEKRTTFFYYRVSVKHGKEGESQWIYLNTWQVKTRKKILPLRPDFDRRRWKRW